MQETISHSEDWFHGDTVLREEFEFVQDKFHGYQFVSAPNWLGILAIFSLSMYCANGLST